MALPAESPDPGWSLQDYAHDYLDAGLALVPCSPGSKRPHFPLLPKDKSGSPSWHLLRVTHATLEDTQRWIATEPALNLAIICGSASRGLVALDVDDEHFSTWLKQHAVSLLSQTWTVQSGSGKLHVYLRSRAVIRSTILRYHERKLADIRADGATLDRGEYIVAPPSLHPSGGRYETLYGGPESIREVQDASLVIREIGRLYLQSAPQPDPDEEDAPEEIAEPAAPEPEPEESASRFSGREIQPPCDEIRKEQLRRMLTDYNVIPGTIRAIREGIDEKNYRGPLKDDGTPDYSSVDWPVVVDLLQAGITGLDDIRDIFSSFAVGEHTYRNPQRPNHGESYLLQTLRNAKAKIAGLRAETPIIHLKNAVILEVVRIESDPPYFEFTFQLKEDQRIEKARVSFDDLMHSERMFRKAVYRCCPKFTPILNENHTSASGYRIFQDLVSKMSRVEPVPLEATSLGFLKAKIAELLRSDRVKKDVPATAKGFSLGFRDDATHVVYIRGRTLLTVLNSTEKQAPAPDKVWQCLRQLGAAERMVALGQDSERLWVLPQVLLRV